ncbi:hypothetical protein CIHG_02508 [Coccidioides immitis H538.4]|uniref:Uncharacterized protein n=3 Tax=Coccidioides immitis TaxID=5501 RepID=A0A0J8R679_COCIT|nr:hypothetical protein CIRG_02840 [Coccidioides immitis RMSCC 2394]KMU79223.1 hypothetical protein CISG_07654 [Coccidioides immitis RMSCC 3703]KMU84724.1 hypothetical protein CIHG_02508 [Coccidioides immitis H538.4]
MTKRESLYNRLANGIGVLSSMIPNPISSDRRSPVISVLPTRLPAKASRCGPLRLLGPEIRESEIASHVRCVTADASRRFAQSFERHGRARIGAFLFLPYEHLGLSPHGPKTPRPEAKRSEGSRVPDLAFEAHLNEP